MNKLTEQTVRHGARGHLKKNQIKKKMSDLVEQALAGVAQ